MHELSIAQSLADIIRQEMAKHGVTRLNKVLLKCGRLTQVVPEALQFGFEAVTVGTDLEGAVIEIEEIPLTVACRECSIEFSPSPEDAVLMTCPACGAELGHKIITGREMYIDHIEAE